MTRSFALIALLAVSASAALAGEPGDGRRAELRALQALATADPAQRQPARWVYASHLANSGRWAEAEGVFEVMLAADPKWSAKPGFALKQGEALFNLGRYGNAIGVMATPALAAAPEACALRLLAHERRGNAAAALAEWGCIRSQWASLPARRKPATAAAVIASHLKLGDVDGAALLIPLLRAGTPLATYWESAVALRSGQPSAAADGFAKLEAHPDGRLRLRAMLGRVQAQLVMGAIKPAEAIAQLDRQRLAWRGGSIETDLLRQLFELALRTHDEERALDFGASLFRYGQVAPSTAALNTRLQILLQTALSPRSGRPLSRRAGLLWAYRDLLPLGPGGDAVIRDLADQLASAGLHGRAADLLSYQLRYRMAPGAGGSLGLQIAEWQMLAGAPDRALAVLDMTRDRIIDPDTAVARRTVETFALLALGRAPEAYALLDRAPGGLPAPVQAELFWQARDWPRFRAANARQLPPPSALNDPAQRVVVIRQLIADASAGDAAEIDSLRSRYGVVLAEGPLSSAFELLTDRATAAAPERLDAALTDIDAALPPPGLRPWLAAFSPDRTAARGVDPATADN